MSNITPVNQSFSKGTRSGGLVSDEWFIKLEQEKQVPEAATLPETADLVDALFQVDPCSGASTSTSSGSASTQTADEKAAAAEKKVTVDTDNSDGTVTRTFSQVMQKYLGEQRACAAAAGKFEVIIRVYRSDLSIPYEIEYGGATKVFGSTISEEIFEVATIVESTSVQLKQPASKDVECSTNNTVITKLGPLPGLPELVKKRGVSITFTEEITATLNLSYWSDYDRIKIRLPVDDEGEPEPVTVTVYYAGLTDSLEVQYEKADSDKEVDDVCGYQKGKKLTKESLKGVKTEPGACWSKTIKNIRYKCSNDLKDQEEFWQPTGCPEGVTPGSVVGVVVTRDEYVSYDPGAAKPEVADPDYYEQICCFPPKVLLPECMKQYSAYYGGVEISGGKEFYINKYGKNVQIIGLSPVGGKCGDSILTQRVVQKSCCDEAPPMHLAEDMTADVLPKNGSAYIGITGGLPPYTYTTSSAGTRFSNNQKTIKSESPGVMIYADPTFCGITNVTATDGCSSVSKLLRSDQGYWKHLGYTDLCLLPGSSETVWSYLSGVSYWSAQAISGKYRVTEHQGWVYNQYSYATLHIDAAENANCENSFICKNLPTMHDVAKWWIDTCWPGDYVKGPLPGQNDYPCLKAGVPGTLPVEGPNFYYVGGDGGRVFELVSIGGVNSGYYCSQNNQSNLARYSTKLYIGNPVGVRNNEEWVC